jgi:hypothetical protein
MLVIRENHEVPGVRFVEFAGKPTDEELTVYIEDERARAQSPAQTSRVMVLRLTEMWTSTQRKRMSDFEREMTAGTKHKQLGLAMVATNSLIRGAFTAYFWLAAPAYPTKMVSSAEDAFDFVVERLQAEGLPIPTAEEFRRAATSEWKGRVARPGRGFVPLDVAS